MLFIGRPTSLMSSEYLHPSCHWFRITIIALMLLTTATTPMATRNTTSQSQQESIILDTDFQKALDQTQAQSLGKTEMEPMQITAGPAGQLLRPPAGKVIKSVGGLGLLTVIYAKYLGQDGETIAVDLMLKPIKENRGGTIVLSNGLTTSLNSSNIVAHFSSRWACGSYKLVVREHQFYKGKHVSFQAAAPKIKITCLPIQKS